MAGSNWTTNCVAPGIWAGPKRPALTAETLITSSRTPGELAAMVGLRKITDTASAVNVVGSIGRSNSMKNPVASGVPSGANVLLIVAPLMVVGRTGPMVLEMMRGPAGMAAWPAQISRGKAVSLSRPWLVLPDQYE